MASPTVPLGRASAKRMKQPILMLEDLGSRLSLHAHGTTRRMSRIRPDRGQPTLRDWGRRAAGETHIGQSVASSTALSPGTAPPTALGSIPRSLGPDVMAAGRHAPPYSLAVDDSAHTWTRRTPGG